MKYQIQILRGVSQDIWETYATTELSVRADEISKLVNKLGYKSRINILTEKIEYGEIKG